MPGAVCLPMSPQAMARLAAACYTCICPSSVIFAQKWVTARSLLGVSVDSVYTGWGMSALELTPEQRQIVFAPVGEPRTTFLEGPAGCGKTTAAAHRMLYLLGAGVRADRMLVWVPQRSLGQPYIDALRRPDLPAGPSTDVLSVDGLARRAVVLFWPVVAEDAGFDPSLGPTFLTVETAQFYMDQVLDPFVDAGLFGDVTVPRYRLLSQILDNLNKSSLVGFSHMEIGQRLTAAWNGASSRERVYEAVQLAAKAFRNYCVEHNLLDFSLQLETLVRHIWPRGECRTYLLKHYRHLIVDNVEEDVPVAHDLLREWLRDAASALVIYDQDGGFRTYLGADPQGAHGLASVCQHRVLLSTSFGRSPALRDFGRAMLGQALPERAAHQETTLNPDNVRSSAHSIVEHFHTELLRSVVDKVVHLIDNIGVSPGEIAIMAPFVGDALRFALQSEFGIRGVPLRTHRPSRALRDEPAARCLLVLARLAHPHWMMCPPPADVAQALVEAVDGMDWVRASYLTDIIYDCKRDQPHLHSFTRLNSEAQARITYVLGGRYNELLHWIEAYQTEPPMFLDLFFSRLFDEVLAHRGFGFHSKYDAAAAAANLIESVRKFRHALGVGDVDELGKRYVQMVEGGVVAAQYLLGWCPPLRDTVFLGPAYTFLAENRQVSYQFWLNANSPAWGRRLYQPLTHPFVLTRNWPRSQKWTEEDEYRAGQTMLRRVVLGLLRRCRERVYLAFSELNPRGYEERGPLLEWIQRVFREAHRSDEASHV